MKIDYGIINDQGMRSINENAYYCNEDNALFIISDGIGGRGFGDEAANHTIKSMISYVDHLSSDSEATVIIKKQPGVATEQMYLTGAINFANNELVKHARETGRYLKMGASITATFIRQRYMSIASTGDIRTYLFRNNKLVKLTTEQTLPNSVVIEFPKPQQDIPIMFAGLSDSVQINSRDEKLKENDTVIIMTSSVAHCLTERELAMIMEEERDHSSEQICKTIVQRSRTKGNRSNSTVLVVKR